LLVQCMAWYFERTRSSSCGAWSGQHRHLGQSTFAITSLSLPLSLSRMFSMRESEAIDDSASCCASISMFRSASRSCSTTASSAPQSHVHTQVHACEQTCMCGYLHDAVHSRHKKKCVQACARTHAYTSVRKIIPSESKCTQVMHTSRLKWRYVHVCAWCGMAQCGAVWRGVVQHGMACINECVQAWGGGGAAGQAGLLEGRTAGPGADNWHHIAPRQPTEADPVPAARSASRPMTAAASRPMTADPGPMRTDWRHECMGQNYLTIQGIIAQDHNYIMPCLCRP
jgi:hypothetical protein